MATLTVKRCPDWQQIVRTLLLSSGTGDVLVVDDYEMAAYASRLVRLRALGVRVLVDAPPLSQWALNFGQDDLD